MTDLAVSEPQAAQVAAIGKLADQPMSTAAALVEWANAARQAGLIAQSLSSTSFVPTTLRGKPAEITAAILAGLELGLQPMATLRSMDVIQGTPALRAHAMRGLVQSHGHDLEIVESTDERCVMRGRRRGSEAWQSVEWTIERAAKLGLTGKDQWKKQPRTMLVARATGELCRLVASDVLYAMPYASEELVATASDAAVVVQSPRVTLEEITGVPEQGVSDWSVEEPAFEPAAAGWPTVAAAGGAE